MTTQPWAGTGGKALAPRSSVYRGSPRTEEQTDNTITGNPGGGLCGTTAHPTLDQVLGATGQGASGFKSGAFKGPLETTSQPPGSREAIPRHAEHQGADPEGPTGAGGGGSKDGHGVSRLC